jgi:hypothetical protein
VYFPRNLGCGLTLHCIVARPNTNNEQILLQFYIDADGRMVGVRSDMRSAARALASEKLRG